MTRQVRVNVKNAIDNSGIRRERRDGRDYIIVPSATMPDGIIMNRIRYPADEIAKAFGSLENTPAPLGHPTVEGVFVSARDPEGLARGWIGAWNRNVRRKNGRVFVDKVIDVATASQLEGGKAVLQAIEKGDPIHTSTGLFAMLTAVENDDATDWEASDIMFDHDAILIGEDGAATPAQGVGMLVNAARAPDGAAIDVIDSRIPSGIEDEIERIFRDPEIKEHIPLLSRIKDAIVRFGRGGPEPGIEDVQEGTPMDKEQLEALSGKVEALANALSGLENLDEKIAAAVTNAVKPIQDQMEADAAARAQREAAEKEAIVNKVVEAGILTEEVANAADVAVLNALLEKHEAGPLPAYRVNGAFKPSVGKGSGAYKLPKAES